MFSFIHSLLSDVARRFTTFPASSELPDTPEEALLFWINKVCTVLRTDGLSTRGLEGVIEGEAGQKVKWIHCF